MTTTISTSQIMAATPPNAPTLDQVTGGNNGGSGTNGDADYDVTADPMYQQLEAQQQAKYDSDNQDLSAAQKALNDYLESHPLAFDNHNVRYSDPYTGQDTTEYWRQDPATLASLQKAVDDAQTAVDQDNAAKDQNEAAIKSYVTAAHEGQKILDAAHQAGDAAQVDLSNLSTAELCTMIMGACNNMTDAIAQMIAKDLQANNTSIATLNNELQDMNSYLPAGSGTDDPDVEVPSNVLSDIQQNGVETPKGATAESGDKAGLTKMKKSELQTLIENIKTQVETMNNNQTAWLQALNKANNNHDERSDLISHIVDTTHDTDSHAIQ